MTTNSTNNLNAAIAAIRAAETANDFEDVQLDVLSNNPQVLRLTRAIMSQLVESNQIPENVIVNAYSEIYGTVKDALIETLPCLNFDELTAIQDALNEWKRAAYAPRATGSTQFLTLDEAAFLAHARAVMADEGLAAILTPEEHDLIAGLRAARATSAITAAE